MLDWSDLPPAVRSAIGELGSPPIVWYRGHTKDHRLVPSLFRFKSGPAQEGLLLERYRQYLARTHSRSVSDWEIVIRMHHGYVPTRLLAWTESLAVALFCALVREGKEPCVFVLDPHGLNRRSGHSSIIRLGEHNTFDYRSQYLEKYPSTPISPVAVEAVFDGEEIPLRQKEFTLHGDDDAPLEDQCPESVRKVTFDEETTGHAQELLLSLKWLILPPD